MIQYYLLLLGIASGMLACQPTPQQTYPYLRTLESCPPAEQQTLVAQLPKGQPLEDACAYLYLTEEDSLYAAPTAPLQWAAALTLDYIDQGQPEEHTVLLYFSQAANGALRYDKAVPRHALTRRFDQSDYETAQKTPMASFPHQHVLHTLLVQALQGDSTAHRLLQQYPTDFELVLQKYQLQATHQRWLRWLHLLQPPPAPPAEEQASIAVFRRAGDPNRLIFPPPPLEAERRAEEAVVGYVYQNDRCLAVAHHWPSRHQLQVWLSVPTYEQPDQPFELGDALEGQLLFIKNKAGYTYQRAELATHLQEDLLRHWAKAYTLLLQQEKDYAATQQVPPKNHQEQLGFLMTRMTYARLMNAPSDAPRWKDFSADFERSLRLFSKLQDYHQSLNQLHELLEASIVLGD